MTTRIFAAVPRLQQMMSAICIGHFVKASFSASSSIRKITLSSLSSSHSPHIGVPPLHQSSFLIPAIASHISSYTAFLHVHLNALTLHAFGSHLGFSHISRLSSTLSIDLPLLPPLFNPTTPGRLRVEVSSLTAMRKFPGCFRPHSSRIILD
jgi:hypothetical protein